MCQEILLAPPFHYRLRRIICRPLREIVIGTSLKKAVPTMHSIAKPQKVAASKILLLVLATDFVRYSDGSAIVSFIAAPPVPVVPQPSAVVSSSPGYITNYNPGNGYSNGFNSFSGFGGNGFNNFNGFGGNGFNNFNGFGGNGFGGSRVCIGGNCYNSGSSSSSVSTGDLVCNSGACVPSSTKFTNPSGSDYSYSSSNNNGLICTGFGLCYLSSSSNNSPSFGQSRTYLSTSSCSAGSLVGSVSAGSANSYKISGSRFSVSSTGQIRAGAAGLTSGTYYETVRAYSSTGSTSVEVTIDVTCGSNASTGRTSACVFNGVICYNT